MGPATTRGIRSQAQPIFVDSLAGALAVAALRANLGSRPSNGPWSYLTRPLDQLADASEGGSQLVPLQQEGLTFLSELIDLLSHRGEAAL